LFGIVGALFAVPLVAVLNTVVTYIVRAKNPNSASDGEGDEAAAVLERAKDKLDTAVHEAAIEESDGDSTKGDSRTD
ncbi:MAG: AI-2E family transporter, partial [Brevibacterium sp.]|nr:AI-2E family transporter [Brevibacterium sp.]